MISYSYTFSIRILPHHQDTGGFFVAVLEKIKPLPWEAQLKSTSVSAESSEQNGVDGSQSFQKEPRKKRIKLGYKEDPFVFFNESEEIWTSIR